MQKQSFIESLFGVLAIWLIVRGIPDYVSTIYLVSKSAKEFIQPQAVVITQAIHFAASLACGFAILLSRRQLTNWLAPSAGSVDLHTPGLVAAGTAIIGLYLVGNGLGSMASYFVRESVVQSNSTFVLWSGASSVAIGVLLFVASPRLAGLWSRLPSPKSNAA